MKRNGNNRAMMASKTRIPEGWRLVRLGDVLKLEYGVSLPERVRMDGNVPVIGSAGVVGFHSQAATDGPGIVVGRKGSIGSITWTVDDFVAIDTTYFVVPIDGKIDLRWAYYLLTREDLSRLNRATGIPGLNRDDVYTLTRLLPPLPEQRAIAAVLDSIDDAIERTEAVIAATERLRDSLLHQLLTRGVPGWHTEWKDVPGLGTIPVGWEVVRLGERIEEGPTNGIYKPESEYGSGVNLIRIGDFAFGQFVNFGAFQRIRATEEEILRYQIREGDVIINRVNSLSHIGKSVLIPEVKEPTLFESNMMKIRFDRGLDLRFGAMVLLSDNTRRYFNAMAKKAVQQVSINQQDVSELPVPLPPLAEQQAIAGLLDGVETTVAATNREREGFQSLKDSTADALLMGRVRVEV